MKIVVLDGYTLNPGDLDWAALQALGDCQIFDRTAPDAVLENAGDAEILLTNKTVLSADTIAELPHLKYIGVIATGYNVVDVVAAKERGIPVTNVPEYSTPSVCQSVFAHLLNFTNRVESHAASVHAGKWSASKDFCFWEHPQQEIAGQTLGIIGLGRIGALVASTALAFGMKVVSYHPRTPAVIPDGVEMMELEDVLNRSDFISLHCPQTQETLEMVNTDFLNQMKPEAFLINTSRGGLIDEGALASALEQGEIAGAGLDVLSQEPPSSTNPLLTAKNCFVTPHIAWATQAARKRLLETVIQNVVRFQQGDSQNCVN